MRLELTCVSGRTDIFTSEFIHQLLSLSYDIQLIFGPDACHVVVLP